MKNLSQILNIFILLAVVATGIIFWHGYQLRHPSEQTIDLSSESKVQESRVNKYMQEVQARLKQEERESKTRMLKRVQAHLEKPAETDPKKVPVENQIWKDPDLEKERSQTLNERVHERLYEENQQRLEEARLRKEYKQQVIENARRDGFQIQLSDNLEIISITPIRQPSGDDTFETHPSN